MKEMLLWGKNPHRDSRLSQQHQQSLSCQVSLAAFGGVTTGHTSGTGKIHLLPSRASCSQGAEKGSASVSLCCGSAAPSGMSLKGGIGDHPLHRDVSTLPGPSAAGEQLLPCWIKSLSRERGIWTGSGDFIGLGLRVRCQTWALHCSCLWWSSRAGGQVIVTKRQL